MITKNLIVSLSLILCAHLANAELATVKNVNLERYLGTWEEIARFDNKHQIGCENSRAVYTQKKGFIEVKNSCTILDGTQRRTTEVTGRAQVGKEGDNAKLKVNFTPFFIRMFGVGWGNYHIIELGNDYDYAVVGEPSMAHLWILSRTRPMSKTLYDDIITRLQAQGFDTTKLIVDKDAVSVPVP